MSCSHGLPLIQYQEGCGSVPRPRETFANFHRRFVRGGHPRCQAWCRHPCTPKNLPPSPRPILETGPAPLDEGTGAASTSSNRCTRCSPRATAGAPRPSNAPPRTTSPCCASLHQAAAPTPSRRPLLLLAPRFRHQRRARAFLLLGAPPLSGRRRNLPARHGHIRRQRSCSGAFLLLQL